MTFPLLYEINTRCWLPELTQRHGTEITLANIPDATFAGWQKLGFTHIWLMGVWTSGPRSRAEALANPHLQRVYSEVLPDWQPKDVSGSPYAIADYHVPPHLGGEGGLREFRERLNQRGMKLILDFVPNHLGLDHPWLKEQPDLFVQSAAQVPETFAQETPAGTRWLAHGKDPFFPAWTDTVQLDYRRAATRAAMTDLLLSVAERCDGVRCDMAMLLLNDIFVKTWERFPVLKPQLSIDDTQTPIAEFWASAVPAVKQAYPEFMFLAEIYWGLEPRLQALGFDYTYDKTLYDELVARNPAGVHHHLLGKSPQFVAASAHFLENHDEHRIASILSPPEHRAAALLILGLPGMRLLHEGQLAGARRKIPVQLIRRIPEQIDIEIEKIYVRILAVLPKTAVGAGAGKLLKPRAAWPDNPTSQNFVIVQWQAEPPDFDLVVVNLAPHRSQCFVPLAIEDLPKHNWSLCDLLGSEEYVRDGEDLEKHGLYLDLPEHASQLFHFSPA